VPRHRRAKEKSRTRDTRGLSCLKVCFIGCKACFAPTRGYPVATPSERKENKSCASLHVTPLFFCDLCFFFFFFFLPFFLPFFLLFPFTSKLFLRQWVRDEKKTGKKKERK